MDRTRETTEALPPTLPGTLGETLWLNARHFGSGIAAATDSRTVTHAELYRRGHRLAAGLSQLGIGRKQRIAVLAMNCAEMIEIYAASEISGIPIVPLNFRLSAAELRSIVADSAPDVLFFEDQYVAVAEALRTMERAPRHYVTIGDAPGWSMGFETLMAQSSPFARWPAVDAEELACILYTSGTTGAPKGCMHSHRSFRAVGELMAAKMGLTASDRGLIMMPLFHMGGKAVQLGLNWNGGDLFIHRTFDPRKILETIARDRITVIHMAPPMIQRLLDEPGIDTFDLSSLRFIFYSAAPMPEPVLRRGLEVFGPVFIQSYGQTEITGTVLPARSHRLEGSAEERSRLTSVGIPPRGVSVKVVDQDGSDCPVGRPGEVLMRSNAAMTGYWNNEPATAEVLRDGWVRTGDVGYLDDAGFLFLVDRKKDVIISGGENIYSREVENALYAHPDVAEVAVIGLPDAEWGEAVCAIIVRTPGSRVDAEALTAHCRTLIAGYKRPRRIEFVDEIPKTPNGKIDKNALRGARKPTAEEH